MRTLYKCDECNGRFSIDHRTAHKSPCPNCEICALQEVDPTNIQAQRTAGDLYYRVARYDGR